MKKLIVVFLAAVLTLGIATAFADPSPNNQPQPVPAPIPAQPAAPRIRPGAPTVQTGPEAASFQLGSIDKVDTFVADLTAELAKNGETLAINVETLEEVLTAVNNPDKDPKVEPMSVEEAVEKLSKGKAAIYEDGKKEEGTVDFSDYSFLSRGFSIMELDKPQTKDAKGNLIPFEANIQSADLVGMTLEEAAKTAILVVNPATGESAVITLNPDNVDTTKGTVKVTLPFDGLFAFIQA